MIVPFRFILALTMAVIMGAGAPGTVSAETYEVMMYTKHPDNPKIKNVFLPHLLKIKPGDTVKFVSVEKGHNTESIKRMIPDGAAKWKSKLSKDFEVTFDQVGYYGYKCTPHYGLGMVGLIVVEGDGLEDGLDAAKSVKQRGKAKKVFAEIWSELGAGG